jgi:DNA polymerase III delta prime subunit
MSLWVDKYRPNTLAKLDFHLEQGERLQKMVTKGNFPHLLIYGPPGAGKKTRVSGNKTKVEIIWNLISFILCHNKLS